MPRPPRAGAGRSRPVGPIDIDIGVGQITGPDRCTCVAGADIHPDPEFGLGEDGAGVRFAVITGAGTIPRHLNVIKPDRQPFDINGWSALPTAMTIRPQLASPAAMAVLIKGELAIAPAMILAEAAVAAPVTSTSTNRLAPSPSLTTQWANWRQTVSRAA